MNDNNSNRRKYERFPFREDILVEGTRLCTSMDISEGGLYVSAIQSFGKNSIVDITIPFKGEKVTLKARVQYCQPGIGMGIMFIDLSDEQKTMIQELIEGIKK
jgi:hypothetical protein